MRDVFLETGIITKSVSDVTRHSPAQPTRKLTGAPGTIGSIASIGATAIKRPPTRDLSVPGGLVMSKTEEMISPA